MGLGLCSVLHDAGWAGRSLSTAGWAVLGQEQLPCPDSHLRGQTCLIPHLAAGGPSEGTRGRCVCLAQLGEAGVAQQQACRASPWGLAVPGSDRCGLCGLPLSETTMRPLLQPSDVWDCMLQTTAGRSAQALDLWAVSQASVHYLCRVVYLRLWGWSFAKNVHVLC